MTQQPSNRVEGTGATDAQGRYSVEFICEAHDGFDPDTDKMFVDVSLKESRGRYDVLYRGTLVKMRSSGIAVTDNVSTYTRHFDFRGSGAPPSNYLTVANNLPKAQWYEWVETFQNTADAWALADLLGEEMDFGLPLDIRADCVTAECSSNEGGGYAFWTENGGAPYVAFGKDKARYADGGRPDNREYHEFGHHFNADAFENEFPFNGGSGSAAHEGYANEDSANSITEGFASWIAAMVNKHVVQRAEPHMYRIFNPGWNLELDSKPWDGAKQTDGQWHAEERAIAGVLLDLEDGPNDYAGFAASPALAVSNTTVGALASLPGRLFVFSDVTNTGATGTLAVHLTAVFKKNGVEVLRASNRVWQDALFGGDTASVSIGFDGALDYDTVSVIASAGGPNRRSQDDDPVDLSLADVWETYRDYRQLNRHLEFASQLYDAFSTKLGNQDNDGDDVRDVDEIFISHGLFTTIDGDMTYEPGVDTLGRTDREGADPRQHVDPKPLTGALLEVGGGPGTAYVVQVSPAAPHDHLGYSYVAEPDSNGRIVMSAPPPGVGGSTTVMAVDTDTDEAEVVDFVTAAEFQAALGAGSPRVASDVVFSTPSGYRMLQADGTVWVFGNATYHGDPSASLDPGETAVAMDVTPSYEGYVVMTSSGRIGSYGDAPSAEETQTITFAAGERWTAVSVTATGQGFWMFTSRGQVLAFGDAEHFGDLGHLTLAGDIVASIATPTGEGVLPPWLRRRRVCFRRRPIPRVNPAGPSRCHARLPNRWARADAVRQRLLDGRLRRGRLRIR